MSGRAVFDSPREVKAKVFALEPGLKAIYQEGADDPTLVTFYLEGGQAMIRDMKGQVQNLTL